MATAKKHDVKMNAQRTRKEDMVADVRKAMEGKSFTVVVESQGLTVAEVTGLRGKIRGAGASFRVVKNTLAKIALQGTKFENLIALMKGPTALAIADEPVGIAKVLADFGKTNPKLKMLGSNLNGDLLDAKSTAKLATLPSLNELRAKIVGMLQTPGTRLAVLLKAPASQLARVMAAKSKKEA
jgi:large subunit ribosomal protein L10